MVRTKISKKRKTSSVSTAMKNKQSARKIEKRSKLKLKKGIHVIPYSPSQELLDEQFIALAIWECLKNNDPEGVVEIIQAHLEVVNKSKATKEALLARSSMYNALKGKNPTVKTLAKLVNCCI